MSDDDRPSVRTRYRIAHLMCEALELPWPETKAEARDLIQRLEALAGNMPAAPEPTAREFVAGF